MCPNCPHRPVRARARRCQPRADENHIVGAVPSHHQRVDFANPGDNVGLNIKGLDKPNMPRSGDVMVYKNDTTVGQTKEFTAQIQGLDFPSESTGGLEMCAMSCAEAAMERGEPLPLLPSGDASSLQEGLDSPASTGGVLKCGPGQVLKLPPPDHVAHGRGG